MPWKSGRHNNRISPSQGTTHSVTLLDIGKGDRARVVAISGERRVAHRLIALGLVPGAVVTVLRPRGPGLVTVNGTRVTLDLVAAGAVAVEALEL